MKGYNINIDTKNSKLVRKDSSNKAMTPFLGDSLLLTINLTEDGQIKPLDTNTKIKLIVEKSDGNTIYQEKDITVLENIIKIKLHNQATLCTGLCICQLEVSNGTDAISTGKFIYTVLDSLTNSVVEESKSEIATISQLGKMLEEIRSNLDDITTVINELDSVKKNQVDGINYKDNKIQLLIGNIPKGNEIEIPKYIDDLATINNLVKSWSINKINETFAKIEDLENKAGINHSHSESHSHANKFVLDNITQVKIDTWNSKSNFTGNYNDLINKPAIPTVDVTKAYVDAEDAKRVSKSYVDLALNYKSTIGHTHKKTDIDDMPTKLSQFANDLFGIDVKVIGLTDWIKVEDNAYEYRWVHGRSTEKTVLQFADGTTKEVINLNYLREDNNNILIRNSNNNPMKIILSWVK